MPVKETVLEINIKNLKENFKFLKIKNKFYNKVYGCCKGVFIWF